jgi:parvulin-like peptidyl-prolyl isomerase
MDYQMKKILPLLLFTLITATNAQVLDAIAIDVEGEAITTLEIQAVQQKMGMSKQAAVEALIKDRLEKSALKKANITIDPAEAEAKAQTIAQSRGMTIDQMKNILGQKGLTWDSYIEQLGTEMKKERFFKEHIISTITPPSDAELETYYNMHKDKFSAAPVQMSLVAYAASTAESLKKSMDNPMQPVEGVQKKNILAASNEMSPQLLNLINATPAGSFTKPVNTGKGFVAYFVKSKGSQGQAGFQAVKQQVTMMWMQEQRGQAGQDFFNKLKSNANIRVIRL